MSLLETIICYVRWALLSMGSILVDFFNAILYALVVVFNVALSVLPQAAIESPDMETGVWATANWFLPLPELVATATIIMIAWVIYRLYQYLMRFAKVE